MSLALILLSACTRHVEVSAVKLGKDLRGLTDEERQRPNWIALDVTVPASIARSIRRWQLSNVTFRVFRCNNPDDYYPADARLNGKAFEYRDLKEPLASSLTMTFYIPQNQGHPEANVCGAFDARGYSPVSLRGQTVSLPPLSMTFYHYDEKTGRSLST